MILRPLIWTTDPSSPQPIAPLAATLESVRLFYAAYNYPLAVLPPAVEPMPATVDLVAENPWNRVWQVLQSQFREGESLLVFLDGWNHPTYLGWGGYPLAVVGDYALSRLRTLWTPGNRWEDARAVVDDAEAAGLCAHEVGHCLGFGHDFTAPNVMGPWWVQFGTGTCVPSKAMIDAQRGLTVARLAAAVQWLEGCRLEGA